MGLPDEVQQIAMSLDELLAVSPREDLPVAGGDCDTRRGWASRMGVGKDAAQRAIQKLTDQGLAEIKTGQIKTSNGYAKADLVCSPTLARLIAERG